MFTYLLISLFSLNSLLSESSESSIQPFLKYDQNGNLEKENAIQLVE